MLGFLSPSDSLAQCRNITYAGYISGDQVYCGSYNPSTIDNRSNASGGSSGNIQYQWEQKTANGSWTRINGATSKKYNPGTITETTQYRRMARRSSCNTWLPSNVITKTVSPGPGATAGGGGFVSCVIDSVQLLGSSPTAGVTYAWVGPWGFSSNEQNPYVTHEGTFVLTVTDPATGCRSTDQIGVLEYKKEPTITASGGHFDCSTGAVTLSSVVTPSGVTYAWTGPNGYNSSLSNPTTVEPGIYTLVVTDTTNGCFASDTALVTGSGGAVSATASGGTITCTTPSLILNGTTSVQGASFTWTGPNGYISHLQNPSTSVPGIYTLTVSNSNGSCSASDTALVRDNQIPPGAEARGGSLSCTTGDISLSGSSASAGVSYSWTGPNGFTSVQQNPTASAAGTYTLVVTNPANGCTSSDTAIVVGSGGNVNALATGGVLSCTATSVQLNGSSTTPSATYSWTGPGGFTSNLQNPTVSTAGIYTLEVTDGAGLCTAYDSALVSEDVNLPGAAATGATLTCVVTTVQLQGSSPATGATYSWTGPNGFTSALQNPTVSVEGIYTLTVSNPSNGCSSTATAQVLLDNTLPGAVASGGNLSCTNGNLALTGSSTTAGVSYSWTGPNGFTSAQQNPTVSVAGTYTLVVTNPANGCTSSDTATVAGSGGNIDALASGGVLTCTASSVQLNGSTSSTGASFSWTGPGGFTSIQQNPTATTAGIYTLTVTDASGNCTASDTALVSEDANLPGATATGATLTCVVTSVQLQGSSPATGVTYSWTGPNGFTSALQNPSVSVEGNYTLSVSNPANGCSSTATAQVLLDNTVPGALATGGNLSCTNGTLALGGSSTTAGVSYSWTGPNGFTSAQQYPTVNTAGTYTLVVTNPANGCTSSDTATVVGSGGNVDALASGGVLTCTSNSVQLNGSTNSTGASFSWTGPGGFTSTQQNPTASAAGIYTLTVTDASGNCTASDTALVSEDANLPGAAIQGGMITCINPTVQLTGSSSTGGVNFSWTGPNGFTSNISNPIVSDSGTYVLTVMNPVNGCSSTASTLVGSDTTSPGASAIGNVITSCIVRTVQIMGDSPTPGVSFSWAGPNGFSSTDQNPIVTDSGTYVLTVTHPNSGCTSTASALVIEDTAEPGALATGGTLTCDFPSINLVGASGTFGVSYSWTGPNGFTSTDQNPLVSATGTYILLVTNNASGCTSSDTTLVDQNTTAPGASATGGALTCSAQSIQILGNSPTAGVLFSWTGPNEFGSSLQNPSITDPGTYTLSVTDPVNGCVSTATAQVTQDANVPNATATGGAITCTNSSIQLGGSSSTAGVLFSWTGPNGFSSALQNPTVSTAGNYVLTVTDPTNGCTASSTAIVADSTLAPGVQANGGQLTCTLTSVQLSASSATAGVSYSWTGPNGFTSSLQNPTVSLMGTYTVTATLTSTGCSSSATASVTEDVTAPEISASADSITCINPIAQLSGNSNTAGASFSWTGPNGFTSALQNPTTSVAGIYTLTVTNPVNGCFSTMDVTVAEYLATPGATATGAALTCTQNTVQLSGSSTTTGVNYSWTGPNGFTSSAQNPDVTVAGVYSLTVTNPATGCSSSDTALVSTNITIPDASATGGTLTCEVTSLQLNGVSSTSNAAFSWAGPGGFSSTAQNPSVTVAGSYILTVTDPANGCTASATATVLENIVAPLDVVAQAMTATCADSVQIVGSSSTNGVSFSWSGPNGFTSSLQSPYVSTNGIYTLTVTDNTNGCSSSDTAFVSFVACAKIGDLVFDDANRDGVQNPGENGIAGVTVELLDASGAVVATDVTDAQGLYEFNTVGGDYSIRFVPASLPAGFVITRLDIGSNDTEDSDADPVSGTTSLNTFVAGVSDLDWDAGAYLFSCNANAGNLVLRDTCLEICMVNSVASITASLDGTESVPPGFEVVYFLTQLPGNIVIQSSSTPSFQVGIIGVYTMHSMVVDTNPGSPDFVDLSLINYGVSNIQFVQSLIGTNVCSDLDQQGVQAQVTVCPGPLAMDDFNNVIQDSVVSGNVLTNDTDPFGGTLEVDTILVIQPAHGTVSIAVDGSYTYTPDPGFIGEDEFTYKVCNINLCPPICSEAIVFIEVLPEGGLLGGLLGSIFGNLAPIANPDVMAIVENNPVDLFVSNNDFDANGNPLSNPLPHENPQFGSAVYNSNGSITYTPDQGFVGRDEFTYKVLDNGSPAKFDIGRVIVHVRSSNSGLSGQPISMDDAIVTGMAQEIHWDVSSNDVQTGSNRPYYTLVEPPMNGVLGSFNEKNGLFSYTPAPGFTGMDKFVYETCNGEGCDKATVYITVFTRPINRAGDQWEMLQVEQVGPDAKLTWATSQEVNSKLFEVERSEDGYSFRKIGLSASAGNSLTPRAYQYLDENVTQLRQNRVYYRIKLIGIDGSHSFSPVAELSIENLGDVFLNAFPNPVKTELNVAWISGEKVDEIRILNQVGQLIFVNKPDSDLREGLLNLDVSKWGRGLYYVHLYTDDKMATKRLFLE